MNTKEVARLDIIQGPNRNEFVAAFLYAYDKEKPGKDHCHLKLVDSEANIEFDVTMTLVKIEHEDGSSHSFNFEGWYQATVFDESVQCHGYYNAQTRKGTLLVDLS